MKRHKALLVLLLNVYFTGSELSALPVTPSAFGGTPTRGLDVGRGLQGCGAEPKAIQLVIKCIRGVLAVHSSDHDTAHHSSNASDSDSRMSKNACAAALPIQMRPSPPHARRGAQLPSAPRSSQLRSEHVQLLRAELGATWQSLGDGERRMSGA
eukprot:COSAG02_NODE_1036_length_15051_cov_25.548154_18_plen_154_part_00